MINLPNRCQRLISRAEWHTVRLKGAGGESKGSRRYDKENLLWQSTVAIKSDPVVSRKGDSLFVHFPDGLDAGGLEMRPLTVLPEKATLLNTGKALKALVLFAFLSVSALAAVRLRAKVMRRMAGTCARPAATRSSSSRWTSGRTCAANWGP